MNRYPTRSIPRHRRVKSSCRVSGPHARRTGRFLTEEDWDRILPLLNVEFRNKTREKLILQMLWQNGNQPLSEEAICELTRTHFFKTGQCQVMNAILTYRAELPYRLGEVRDHNRNSLGFKLFVVEGGRSTS